MLLALVALPEPDLGPVLAALRRSLPVSAAVSFVVAELADVDDGYRQALLARRALSTPEVVVTTLAERCRRRCCSSRRSSPASWSAAGSDPWSTFRPPRAGCCWTRWRPGC